MNNKDKEVFINFLYNEFSINNNLYLESDNSNIVGLYFYGTQGCEIYMEEKGNDLYFRFRDVKEDKILNIIKLPFKDCVQFLNYAFTYYDEIKLQNSYYQGSKLENFIMKELEFIKEYLKKLPETKDEAYLDIKVLNKYNKSHIIKLDSSDGSLNKQANLCGIITIPINLIKDDLKECVKLIIPNWEIKNYPYLKNFVHIESVTKSMQDFLNNVKEDYSQLANNVQYQLLNNSIENKIENKTNKKLKI